MAADAKPRCGSVTHEETKNTLVVDKGFLPSHLTYPPDKDRETLLRFVWAGMIIVLVRTH
jgi:hypothetical protein